MSCLRKTVRYRMLPHSGPLLNSSPSPSDNSAQPTSGIPTPENDGRPINNGKQHVCHIGHNSDSDLVLLKITLLGDHDIGKSSFLVNT